MKKIVLASNNQGKLKEFYQMLEPLGIELHSQSEFQVPDSPEPFFTFIENALIKARHAAKITGLPAIADDSGLCVPALSGAPGVFSARYAGEPKSDHRNNMKLVSDLSQHQDKSAYYYCILVYVRSENDPQPIIADGTFYGEIIDVPRGQNGFGYDPYFYLKHLDKTVAELDPVQKNHLSHRGHALRILVEKLK